MRNQTSELWIPLSDAPPLSHRDSIVSEVYYEVPSSIPHGDSKFFSLSYTPDNTKTSFSSSMEV